MFKAFTLLELIIVILIISIITSFSISKFSTYNKKTNMTKLKSQIAIIRNELANKRSENVLLGNGETIETLDNSAVDIANLKLFTQILDLQIISTNSSEKKYPAWAKTSDTSYKYYLSSSESVKFSLKDEYFICKSSYEVCKDFE